MSLEAVDLNLVLVLHHVLAEGTVVRAAERLHVTPSAVSNSLARLRGLLGDPLFVRRGRTVVPTPLARELAPQVATTVERLRVILEAGRKWAPAGRRLTLKRFLEARHVEVALQGKHAIDYVDGVLSRLGHRRSIALSVPQFALAAGCVIGTPYITMLPASMAKGLASALPLAVHRPPFELPAITILQLWHARSDADPGSMLLRAIIRRVGKEARV